MNSDSFLFRTVSQEKLSKCCEQYLEEPLVGWELLKGGLFNTTYRLDTASRSVILRIGPVNRHRLLPYEQNLMAAELCVQNLLHSHGIPTSRTILMDPTRKILDRDVSVVAFIPGINMLSREFAKEEEQKICRQLGELAKKIHNISAQEYRGIRDNCFGRVSLVLDGKGSSSWEGAILSEAEQWAGCALEGALFDETDLERIMNCFRRFSPLLQAVKKPQLVHGDLWYGNILLREDLQIAALIDGDRAFFGDPAFDLASPWIDRAAFLDGYGIKELDRDTALRCRIYRFLIGLEDCHVLKTEYNNPQGFCALKQEMLEELRALESIAL